MNVEAIREGLGELFSFPYTMDDDLTFDGPALFVSGERSSFLK